LNISHGHLDESHDDEVEHPKRSLYIDDEIDIVPDGDHEPSRIFTKNDISNDISHI